VFDKLAGGGVAIGGGDSCHFLRAGSIIASGFLLCLFGLNR
jgi:hypothetical protein